MDGRLSLRQRLQRMIKRDKRRTANLAWLALILVFSLMLCLDRFEVTEAAQAGQERGGGEDRLAVAVAGWINLGPQVGAAAGCYGCDYLFKYTAACLGEADWATGGLTVPGAPVPGAPAPEGLYPGGTTAAPFLQEALESMRRHNFAALSLAGPGNMPGEEATGLLETLSALRRFGLAAAGAGRNLDEAMAVSYRAAGGVTVAVLGFSDAGGHGQWAQPGRGGILPADPTLFMPLIREAKRNASVTIVYLQWAPPSSGGSAAEEDSRRADLARAMVDAGADLVVGYRDGEPGPVELYRDALIVYNIGSFVSGQNWTSASRLSTLLRYCVEKDGGVRIELVPLWVRGGRPRPLTDDSLLSRFRRAQLFRLLTAQLPAEAYRQEENLLIIEPGRTLRPGEGEGGAA